MISIMIKTICIFKIYINIIIKLDNLIKFNFSLELKLWTEHVFLYNKLKYKKYKDKLQLYSRKGLEFQKSLYISK